MRTSTHPQLRELLQESPYQAYVYSYPHKTSYRALIPPIALRELWLKENRQSIFLYIHIPFCEMRCGFCNLFTTAKTTEDFVNAYINAVGRQAQRVKAAIGETTFVRFALGGGTPTQLPIAGLEAILDIAEEKMGAKLSEIPGSVEVSPATVDRDKLHLLRDRGLDRVSIGVQSFIDSEVLAVQRSQRVYQVETALTLMREVGFPTINIDLIYGLPGQTVDSWLQSIRVALQFQPEEIYLYPLYVRPLTGMGKSSQEWDDIRLECYREGRSFLISQGYTQVSMRMFQITADRDSRSSPNQAGPIYCCQADGMVGLGCGARSYTSSLHYSYEYAVEDQQVRQILKDFINTPAQSFDYAHYGFQLDAQESRRRYILLSLLAQEGLNLVDYHCHFTTEAFLDFPELSELLQLGLADRDNQTLHLTEMGMERSDNIGSWLFSEQVRQLMQTYQMHSLS
ncbi:MAG: coproporphyrinogen III oxidase family protein [Symploca sp. SIO3E6]|nr:coproporphyrinogen III oxidase family protein [Caldora sp. SIO3E6]